MRIHTLRRSSMLICLVLLLGAGMNPARADQNPAEELNEAASLIGDFTGAGANAIPEELLARARGIAVIPNVFRGGIILAARRGRGVLSVRLDDGSWSNPAFIKLTGGSLGWQFGAETTDIVLVFANENAVKNIGSGKFTLGGEATAIAGPLRSQAASNLTFKAEVYGYTRSRGLYAGAAFEGARLDVDEELGYAFYGSGIAQALSIRSGSTPQAASGFLRALDGATGNTTAGAASAQPRNEPGSGATRTFPLAD